MRRIWCWLFGHADILAYSVDRIAIRCLDCGRETPGIPVARAQIGRSTAA
jgi:hypothetical protein